MTLIIFLIIFVLHFFIPFFPSSSLPDLKKHLRIQQQPHQQQKNLIVIHLYPRITTKTHLTLCADQRYLRSDTELQQYSATESHDK